MDKLRIIQTIEQTIYKSLKVSQKLNRVPENWSNCDEIKILETILLKIGGRNELPLQKSSKISVNRGFKQKQPQKHDS